MLYNFIQGLRDTFIVKQSISSMDHMSSSFLCAVTRSVKNNPKLALEVNKTGYTGDSIAMGKRIEGGGTRAYKSSTDAEQTAL